MGSEQSTLTGVEGYQIVRVMNNSPAHVAGLVPFFDFITAVDGLALDRDSPGFFFDYVRRGKDKAITCSVYNTRVRAVRDVTVVPSDCWGGVGLLGCNVCWETADSALESTWHVVGVEPSSPALAADIMAQRDYIVGMQPAEDPSTITTFRDGNDFHARVELWRARAAHPSMPKTVLLMVYDSVSNGIKEVQLDMSRSLSLGVDVANGYLHVVPHVVNGGALPTLKRFVVAVPRGAPQTQQLGVAAEPPAQPAFPQAPTATFDGTRPAAATVAVSPASGAAATVAVGGSASVSPTSPATPAVRFAGSPQSQEDSVSAAVAAAAVPQQLQQQQQQPVVEHQLHAPAPAVASNVAPTVATQGETPARAAALSPFAQLPQQQQQSALAGGFPAPRAAPTFPLPPTQAA